MKNTKNIAIVYCEGAFNTPNGKTAHGLVRFTERYDVRCVIDSRYQSKDAGAVLDGSDNGIPIVGSLAEAVADTHGGTKATHFVVGLAPDGGRLSPVARAEVEVALRSGLNVDAGLHDYLSDDPQLSGLAAENDVVIRDVRKTPAMSDLHFFTGKIEEVRSLKVAVLGTDSAVGKRTTAWRIVHGFRDAGLKSEMVGTGQTAWLQGARYSIILDSVVNDFLSGEIEHAVWQAWDEEKPDVIVVEGQGSLMNPAYPGGFEILAAARPDVIVLQHAPARAEYDGFPGYPIHPLPKQIAALEMISDKPVVAVTINHELIPLDQLPFVTREIERTIGLPTMDVLVDGASRLIDVLRGYAKGRSG